MDRYLFHCCSSSSICQNGTMSLIFRNPGLCSHMEHPQFHWDHTRGHRQGCWKKSKVETSWIKILDHHHPHVHLSKVAGSWAEVVVSSNESETARPACRASSPHVLPLKLLLLLRRPGSPWLYSSVQELFMYNHAPLEWSKGKFSLRLTPQRHNSCSKSLKQDQL